MFDRALGDSTVLVLQGFNILNHNENGTYTATSTHTAKALWNFCPKERFAEQLILDKGMTYCSGFLIGADPGLVGTAAHCAQGFPTEYWIIFGFELTGPDDTRLTFRADDVYFVEKILAAGTPSGDKNDYGVLQLDRAVSRHAPYTKVNHNLEVDDPLALVGYPMGLPKKTDKGGKVTQVKGIMIRGDVDSYQGSSGSPVFDGNGLLAGILVGGSDDFVDDDEDCRFTAVCPGDGGCEKHGEYIVPVCVLLRDPAVREKLPELAAQCDVDTNRDQVFTYELVLSASGQLPLISLSLLLLLAFLVV